MQPANVVPVLFLVTSLGIVVYDATRAPASRWALVLASNNPHHRDRPIRPCVSYSCAALAESRREARTDELPGLPNRRLFFERLAASLEPSTTPQRLAILMIDLDRFKEINDSLGHHVGDDDLASGLGPRLTASSGSHRNGRATRW